MRHAACQESERIVSQVEGVAYRRAQQADVLRVLVLDEGQERGHNASLRQGVAA